MGYKNKGTLPGVGLGMLLGAVAGAAGLGYLVGMPSKRKVKRKLMHAADAMGGALENLYDMMK